MPIPKIIHQTIRDKRDIHPAFVENINRLKALNEGWQHRLYDNEDMLEYFRRNCNADAQRAFEKINPALGQARSDYFRYHLMRETGGVYLDIKSTATQKLDDVLDISDEYVLSHWSGDLRDWGQQLELGPSGEFQQWHIICAPHHPFLEAVIARVTSNINQYHPSNDGIGKIGVIRVTGGVAYTLAIETVLNQYPHRVVDIAKLGFKYSIMETTVDKLAHEAFTGGKYRTARQLVVIGDYSRPPTINPPRRLSPCPCGSGKKYKHCHGALQTSKM